MSRSKAILLMVAASILWSFGGVFIKLLPWTSFAIAGLRSLVSATVVLIYLKGRIKRPSKHILLGTTAYTAMLILYVCATKATTAANAILLQYTAPIWLALISRIFLKEKIQRLDIMSIVTVFMGISIFFTANISVGQMFGNFLAILSGISLACVVLSLKHAKAEAEMQMIFWGNFATFIICLPLMGDVVITTHTVGSILFLGIFQLGISYIIYANAVKHVSSIDAILVPIIEPLFNPIWVIIFAHEAPSIQAVIGGIIVVMAIVARNILMTKQQKKNRLIEEELAILKS